MSSNKIKRKQKRSRKKKVSPSPGSNYADISGTLTRTYSDTNLSSCFNCKQDNYPANIRERGIEKGKQIKKEEAIAATSKKSTGDLIRKLVMQKDKKLEDIKNYFKTDKMSLSILKDCNTFYYEYCDQNFKNFLMFREIYLNCTLESTQKKLPNQNSGAQKIRSMKGALRTKDTSKPLENGHDIEIENKSIGLINKTETPNMPILLISEDCSTSCYEYSARTLENSLKFPKVDLNCFLQSTQNLNQTETVTILGDPKLLDCGMQNSDVDLLRELVVQKCKQPHAIKNNFRTNPSSLSILEDCSTFYYEYPEENSENFLEFREVYLNCSLESSQNLSHVKSATSIEYSSVKNYNETTTSIENNSWSRVGAFNSLPKIVNLPESAIPKQTNMSSNKIKRKQKRSRKKKVSLSPRSNYADISGTLTRTYSDTNLLSCFNCKQDNYPANIKERGIEKGKKFKKEEAIAATSKKSTGDSIRKLVMQKDKKLEDIKNYFKINKMSLSILKDCNTFYYEYCDQNFKNFLIFREIYLNCTLENTQKKLPNQNSGAQKIRSMKGALRTKDTSKPLENGHDVEIQNKSIGLINKTETPNMPILLISSVKNYNETTTSIENNSWSRVDAFNSVPKIVNLPESAIPKQTNMSSNKLKRKQKRSRKKKVSPSPGSDKICHETTTSIQNNSSCGVCTSNIVTKIVNLPESAIPNKTGTPFDTKSEIVDMNKYKSNFTQQDQNNAIERQYFIFNLICRSIHVFLILFLVFGSWDKLCHLILVSIHVIKFAVQELYLFIMVLWLFILVLESLLFNFIQ